MDKDYTEVQRMLRFIHVTVERAGDSIFWVDPEANVLQVNKTACNALGYSRTELTEMKVFDFDTLYQKSGWSDFWSKLREEAVLTFESEHRAKDGLVFPVEIIANLVEFEGGSYACSFVRDITERKRAEESLRKAFSEIETLKNRLQAENVYLQEEIKVAHNFEEIISAGDNLKSVFRKVEQVAGTDATVLILGETGTGKELVARAIHNISPRKERPIVKVNCAALPANLIESELFGHERGAFTGAIARRIGRFELAHKGTIFLDEIGDFPLELQAKLLRVLQEGEFERLGGTSTIEVDARVITATNRDLQNAVATGGFREDLYYRLNVFPIEIPPLRQRKEDIPLLVKHFVEKYSSKIGRSIERIPRKVLADLQAYGWPGNVREVENVIERAVILSSGGDLNLGDWLPKTDVPVEAADVLTLDDLERRHIVTVLDLTAWRVSGDRGAARILGLKPTTLEARMKKLGIQRGGYPNNL